MAAGWSEVAVPKPQRMWLEAERQGEFYSGQNAKPLQVSVSGQPTRHGKRLKERDTLGSTAVPGEGARMPWEPKGEDGTEVECPPSTF